MKEAALSKAITEFRNQIDNSDYANLGAKGKYLTVPYRIKFIREHFGERILIQTESYECADGMFRFKANIYLDNMLISVGESKQNVKKDKEFEKQQTVAIGRGLSFAGFFGDEIATAEEMEQFLKPSATKIEQKTIDVNAFADEWINKMAMQSKNSVSQSAYEKGMMPLREEYQQELHQISSDLMLQNKIDEAEIKLKNQINERKSNGGL